MTSSHLGHLAPTPTTCPNRTDLAIQSDPVSDLSARPTAYNSIGDVSGEHRDVLPVIPTVTYTVTPSGR